LSICEILAVGFDKFSFYKFVLRRWIIYLMFYKSLWFPDVSDLGC
jgi:hypothetical protein